MAISVRGRLISVNISSLMLTNITLRGEAVKVLNALKTNRVRLVLFLLPALVR